MQRELFEERFRIDVIDPKNKAPFRNVSRVHLSSYEDKQNKREMELDINVQIYPITLKDSFMIKITSCQNVRNVCSQEELSKPSERDNYDYVMNGTVFEIEQSASNLIIFASFGGLLMRLQGGMDSLARFRKDGTEARIYLMLKKT